MPAPVLSLGRNRVDTMLTPTGRSVIN